MKVCQQMYHQFGDVQVFWRKISFRTAPAAPRNGLREGGGSVVPHALGDLFHIVEALMNGRVNVLKIWKTIPLATRTSLLKSL